MPRTQADAVVVAVQPQPDFTSFIRWLLDGKHLKLETLLDLIQAAQTSIERNEKYALLMDVKVPVTGLSVALETFLAEAEDRGYNQ